MQVFEFNQPLPSAATTTVIEASAGTGKTFAIAGLVARYIAEGHPLSEILALTFSRSATAELRDGIRGRLVRSRDLLAGARAPSDQVDAVLADGSPAELAARHSRMVAALGQIDAAPIGTLHAFAKRMLEELGLLADHDIGASLGTDLEVLKSEVIADAYLSDDRWLQLGWPYANQLGTACLGHLFEPLHPTDDPTARLRVQFAGLVRDLYAERKMTRRLLDFDDMVGRLASTLAPDNPAAQQAADALSGRFKVVLIDEFQDTDPQQWAFLSQAFHGRSAVILIGDPKQAIYRFRGGDIDTYARARDSATSVLTMGTNHRSDRGVVQGIEFLFGPVDMGTESAPIRLRQVDVRHTEPRLLCDGRQLAEAVWIRALDADAPGYQSDVNIRVRRDVQDQVEHLLAGRYSIVEGGNTRLVRPGDIAILVNANWAGREIHEQLTGAGHAAVFTGEGSVFDTDAADDWLRVLEALESSSSWLSRRAMLTSLVGWDVARFAESSGQELIAATALLTRCARLLADQGVAAVFEALATETDLYERVLARDGGEAKISDLRHIAEILNETQRRLRLSPAALTEYLRRRIERAESGQEFNERPRRLPTDRQAIKILTVHQAKGLQFPIVLLPQAYDAGCRDDNGKPVIGQHGGVRVLDVADPANRGDRAMQYRREELAESLRKFYVACTRAQSLLISWWAPAKGLTETSPIHRLLSNGNEPGRPPDDAYVSKGAARLTRRCHINLVTFTAGPIKPSESVSRPATLGTGLLNARKFADHIDRTWTRTSYTGLTAAVHGQPVPASDAVDTDETPLEADLDGLVDTVAGLDAAARVSALAELPGGVQFGSLVHSVLEGVDPASATLADDLREQVDEILLRSPLPGVLPEPLVAGLEQTLTTPLGVLTDGRSLRELGGANQLAELDFELPLGTADRQAEVADLAELFTQLSPDDPLQHYGHQLRSSTASQAALRGFLTGSIDVVLQVPGTHPRYVVLDYKTNRMPTPPGVALTVQHYSPAAMARAMAEAHYPLQALLYSVALHRYLAWRLPGYDPETHLGGVGYLFIRGMAGPETPLLGSMPAGVFTWLPPAEMVLRASELLAGGNQS
ncbi:MAG: UvrD-helicase domain-containing protein [Brooklawnia sp.]|jgi:exodeoxyribonuclease V beta subunit